MSIAELHDEVLAALIAAGRHPDDAARRTLGDAIRRDRGSAFEYVGLRFPDRRRTVRQGFSFYRLDDEGVLAVWDGLWRMSPNGDVLFAALDYFQPIVRRRVSPILWPVVRGWIDRVDNWAHCDELGSLYSWILAEQRDVRAEGGRMGAPRDRQRAPGPGPRLPRRTHRSAVTNRTLTGHRTT